MRTRIHALGIAALVASCTQGPTTPPRPSASAAASPAPPSPAPRASAATTTVGGPKRPSPLPVPPSQGTPWVAPPGVDASTASAVREAFALGLADPRALPYQPVKVPTGDVWQGAGREVETSAFVLPAAGAPRRHCVTWAGLVHPCVVVDAPAKSVEDDVAALLKRDADERADYKRRNPTGDFHRFPSIAAEYAVAADTPSWTKVVMLQRLGRRDLADKVARALGPAVARARPGPPAAEDDLFFLAATEWLWARYDRAVTSHMAGDHTMAWVSAEDLADATLRADAACDARGLPRRTGDKGPASFFAFTENAKALADDALRRLGRGARSFDAAALEKLTPDARIAALVDLLDEVAERQFGQPGGVDLGGSPIVRALVKEGAPAVEPLLVVLEKDDRLTRSVHFWRDFSRHRSLLGVHEAAYVALAQILEVNAFEPVATGDDLSARGPAGRAAVAKAIRAHVAKWSGVSLEERWLRTLADDAAKPTQWVEAAASITQPSNVSVSRSSMVFTTTTSTSGGPTTMRGEPLRAKTAPSVSELLAKRAASAPRPRERCQLAVAFAAWDPAGSAAPLGPVFRALADDDVAGQGEARDCIAALAAARKKGGHAGALKDYAGWLERVPPRQHAFGSLTIFAPMAESPNDPDVARAASRVFARGSGWLPELGKPKSDVFRLDILELPLTITALRERAIEYLDDKTVVGKSRVDPNDSVHIELANGGSTGQSVGKGDPHMPPVGTVGPIRMCDYAAWQLESRQAALRGTPAFGMHWPEGLRDQGVARIRAALRAMK